MLGEIKAETALHAKEFLVDAGEVAIVGAQDLVIAHAERGLATIRAMGADGRDILHLPRPRLVTVRAARERANRANIDTHAAFFAFEMIAGVGNNDGMRPAHAHAEGLHIHAFITYTHAAIAKDAAWRIVIDQVGPFLFW